MCKISEDIFFKRASKAEEINPEKLHEDEEEAEIHYENRLDIVTCAGSVVIYP